MSLETLSILEQLSRDKGIDKDVLIDALKASDLFLYPTVSWHRIFSCIALCWLFSLCV